jgi:hypothetical protein
MREIVHIQVPLKHFFLPISGQFRRLYVHVVAPNVKSVGLQAGQCGNQIGAKFWEVRPHRYSNSQVTSYSQPR